MATDAGDPLFFPCDNPGLRAPEQLVSAAGNHVHSGRHALSDLRLVLETEAGQINKTSAPQVFYDRNPRLISHLHQVLQEGAGGEPNNPEVAAMNSQEGPSLRPNRVAVIVDRGAV